MADTSFVCGGPVRFDSPYYIIRRREDLVFRSINNKDFVTVIGPRQIGKTSLMQRIQAIVESNYEYASALIDLSTINDPNLNFVDWAYHFCRLLSHQLRPFVVDSIDLNSPSAPVEFRDYWTKLVQLLNKPSLMILLDEANSVPMQVNDPFYSTIRSIYTDRKSYRPDKNLLQINFAFAGVFEPERLVKNRQNSPFNVSKIIRLRDFDREEISVFTKVLSERVRETIPIEVIDRIFYWTSGHPYLTQTLFSMLQEKIIGKGIEIININLIDNMIPETIEITSDNVDHCVKLVLDNDDKTNKVIQILEGKKVGFSRANWLIAQLELDGILKEGKDNTCVIRNAIYELALKKALDITLGSNKKNEAVPLRKHIFISYSHSDDPKYLKKLQTHLKLLGKNHDVIIWDDTKIQPGQKWQDEIKNALSKTKIAILMVSPDFLVSDFITDHEIPVILDAAKLEKDDLTIIWIPVSTSAYWDSPIAKYQSVLDPCMPLDKMSDAELNKALVNVYEAVKNVLAH